MNKRKVIEKARRFAKPFRVANGQRFRLKDIDPGDTLGLKSEDKSRTTEELAIGIQALAELQDRLYAQDKWAVLAIFQAMDAAGKDGAIKACHVGCQPAGMPSLFLQVSFCRRPRSRLSLALHQAPAQSWAYRHLQPELLRG